MTSTKLSVDEIAQLHPGCVPGSSGFKIQLGQTIHRNALIGAWAVQEGDKVLELGCGQGDMTSALANQVGPLGHIVALDPAPASYGSPYNLGQAQKHLEEGALGDRITFHVETETAAFLSKDTGVVFDSTILAHCLWYFANPSTVKSTFQMIRSHTNKLHLAEWSLKSSHPDAKPHVLAAFTQALLETHKPSSSSNIRTVLSPSGIKKLTEETGLKLVAEGLITPGPDMADARWEVGHVLSDAFLKEIEEVLGGEGKQREKEVVIALRDSVKSAVDAVEGGIKGCRCMDAWWGTFEKA